MENRKRKGGWSIVTRYDVEMLLRDNEEAKRNFDPVEYLEQQKRIHKRVMNSPMLKDPVYRKEVHDSACIRFFSEIQKIREEMADYVLVEPMGLTHIIILGAWAHFNFKAKHKDAADSSSAIYFAEFDVVNKKLTCFAKLDIDLSADTSAYQHCAFCHPDCGPGKRVSASGVGCVLHPIDADRRLK